MLLGNYGRDHQVGDSSGFDGSQTPSILHHHSVVSAPTPGGVVIPPSLATSAQGDVIPSKPGVPADQMLAACQRAAGTQERRLKPHSDQVLKCPRCDSMNTKFCYYNNYSLTQPRHFCKNCKRYWTKGGALRNVPVGGGCRKNKRVKQRQSDQQQQQHHHHQPHAGGVPSTAPPPSSGSDEVTNASGGLTSDGASSSGILHSQEFVSGAATSANSGGLFDVPKGSNGISLGFDRIDVPRIFPGNNHHHHHHHHHPPPPPPPISLNWAAQMALGNSQAYETGILGLNLSAGIKQEPVHATDMNAMFDPTGLGMSSSPHVPEGLTTYAPMESFGLNGGAAGEVLWRFQQPPKLVSLLEEGNDPESRQLLDLESGGGGESMRRVKQHKGKGSRESMQVSSDYEQGDTSSSPEWQPTSDGFFDSGGGETGYWSNGAGWTSAAELHSYGPHSQAATGNHQML